MCAESLSSTWEVALQKQRHQRCPRQAQAARGHAGDVAGLEVSVSIIPQPSWVWVWDVFGVTGTEESDRLLGRSFSSQLCRLPRCC